MGKILTYLFALGGIFRMGTTWLCIHINSNGSLFLWNPSSMESCQNTKLIKNDSAAKLAINNENQVGDWYKINGDTAVKAERPGICETRIRKNRLEVKAPVVFFSRVKQSDAVGFAPGFGRVGCFVRNGLQKDRIYAAWITYVEFVPSPPFQRLLCRYKVSWILADQSPELMPSLEVQTLAFSNKMQGLNKTAKGVIVDECAKTNSWMIYSPLHGLCQYYKRPDEDESLPVEENLKIGSFVKFVPTLNTGGIITPLQVESISCISKGISLVASTSQLKLTLLRWKLKQSNAAHMEIHIPSWDLTIPLDSAGDSYAFSRLKGKPLIIIFDSFRRSFVPELLTVQNTRDNERNILDKRSHSISSTESDVTVCTESISTASPDCECSTNQIVDESSFIISSENNTRLSVGRISTTSTDSGYLTNQQDGEFEADAVVTYVKDNIVALFAIRTELPKPKFYTERYRFKEEPKLGDWFRVSLRFKVWPKVFLHKAVSLVRPPVETEVLDIDIVKLRTRVKVTTPTQARTSILSTSPFPTYNKSDEAHCVSEDVGIVMDNKGVLAGIPQDQWIARSIISCRYTDGAHWRVYCESKNGFI
ncbi:hypothetical protein DdX_12446 [Ditylenchus destructor]|uniref:Uncharacterized protein n=1 Tax=Ditylenchus destructor TaxID=166010 RepID=A0AAD4MWZ6_9BILA|nr:hypothetical protein DdX_12446 [Ditylenchus destructor]